ncbi:magnesium transporter [Pholiota molesta]|nr:magnesium transporter [Pholiota molesta]
MSASRSSGDPGASSEALLRTYETAEQDGNECHHEFDLHIGAEPGVDPLSERSNTGYTHFRQDCAIDIIDYKRDDVKFRRFNNEGLINLMKESGPKPHPMQMVRWINIGGIDWAVLSAVAVRYKLHSLALEDILHEQGNNHSKADYYPGHLFIRILSHTVELTELEDKVEGFDSSASYTPLTKLVPGSQPTESVKNVLFVKHTPEIMTPFPQAFSSHETANNNHKTHILTPAFHSPLNKRMTGLSGLGGLARESTKAIEFLKKGDLVAVKREPIFIFLLPDGTVISICNTPSLEFTQPIKDRLHLHDSILRVSEDASLLVEALLDLVVDHILEVVDEYQIKLSGLEHDILLRPAMRSVRSLHILSGDLTLKKRTLDPIRTMINGLRNDDLQRCQALANNLAKENCSRDEDEVADAKKGGKLPSQGSVVQADAGKNAEPQLVPDDGYFSFQSKMYMVSSSFDAAMRGADVADHMGFALSSLDMNRLTIISIVFLPLTLLTGYFVFAIPVMLVLIPLVMYRDVKNFVRYLLRREDSRRVARRKLD